MGRAMKNLDRLLAMPYGCGEQNMVLFAPNIFILNYLKSTNQLTTEIQDKATRFLESGKSWCVPVSSQYKKLSKMDDDLDNIIEHMVKSDNEC